jgi:hypothetical protein
MSGLRRYDAAMDRRKARNLSALKSACRLLYLIGFIIAVVSGGVWWRVIGWTGVVLVVLMSAGSLLGIQDVTYRAWRRGRQTQTPISTVDRPGRS